MRGVFDIEQWKDVLGWEERYEVSNLGRVRSKSFLKQGANRSGPFCYLTSPKILKPNVLSDGYEQVKFQHFGTKASVLVHRVVALAFLPPAREDQTQVNHKDSDRANNRVSNLEWVTPSENMLHGFKYGNKDNSGENHPRTSFSDEDVRNIRALHSQGMTYADIGRRYGVTYQAVSAIVRRINWGHLM